MWISSDGRAITNAWADPAAVLPDSVTHLIDSLSERDRESLAASLAQEFLHQLDLIEEFAASTTPEIEARYEEEWMPSEAIAHLRARSVDEILTELRELDFRWRLDAFHVVEDHVDG